MIKRYLQTGCALLLAGSLLGGCTLPHTNREESLQSVKLPEFTLAEIEEMNWPGDTWWNRYRDPQLHSLIEEALADSPAMATAQARLKNARGIAMRTGALKSLHVGGSATASLAKVSYRYQAYMPPEGWNDYGSTLLDFSYDFDFWGKNRASIAAVTSRMAAVEAEQAAARIILSTTVANSYVELARLYANLDTVKAALQVRLQTVELLGERYASGLETKGAVSQAVAASAGIEGEFLALQEAIKLQKNGLAALLGKGPDRCKSLTRPDIELTQKFGLPADASVGLLGHRADISAARWLAEAASQEIHVARTQFYPDVSISAFLGFQAFGLSDLFKSGNDTGTIAPAIYLPIFSGGRLEGQLSSAEARYEIAVNHYRQTLIQAIHQVADATTSQQALGLRIAKTEEAVEAAREAHQIASNRYRGGLAGYLDVLTAEDALISSQRALVNLQSRAFSLDLALVHALGGGYTSQNA